MDNQILSQYLSDFDPFFDCFLQFRRDWPNIISYIQRISPSEYGQTPPLSVVGGYTVKGERGSRNTANEDALRELARIDFIQDLEIVPGQQVSFRFRDLNTRAWLRDVGSALELYAYKACVDSAIFHDIISSAVVRWDEVLGHGSVSNEIDVMAARGVIPLFLSCKACDIKTEALNELAILRDRFGGKGAKAAIVTTEVCNAAARHRPLSWASPSLFRGTENRPDRPPAEGHHEGGMTRSGGFILLNTSGTKTPKTHSVGQVQSARLGLPCTRNFCL